MRKITVLSMISLDGVMQGPGGPEEDTENEFRYGGWVTPFSDEEYNKVVTDELKEPVDYLLGRKTFEIWENYWPHHADFWPGINEGTKYVLSNTRETSEWKPSVFLRNADDIRALISSEGKNIQVWGSSELIHLLLKNDLVDIIRLKIHPILLGKGKKLFDNNAMPAAFRLNESIITSSGVIIAEYQKSGVVKTGSMVV